MTKTNYCKKVYLTYGSGVRIHMKAAKPGIWEIRFPQTGSQEGTGHAVKLNILKAILQYAGLSLVRLHIQKFHNLMELSYQPTGGQQFKYMTIWRAFFFYSNHLGGMEMSHLWMSTPQTPILCIVTPCKVFPQLPFTIQRNFPNEVWETPLSQTIYSIVHYCFCLPRRVGWYEFIVEDTTNFGHKRNGVGMGQNTPHCWISFILLEGAMQSAVVK